MLTPLKSLSLVLVMISSMSVPICNRFCARRGNSGKITFLIGYPFRRPRVQAFLNLRDDNLDC